MLRWLARRRQGWSRGRQGWSRGWRGRGHRAVAALAEPLAACRLAV